MDLETINDVGRRLKEQVHRVIVGQDDVLDFMMTALMCEGHVLLEGVPGTAKTLLVRTFAACLSLDFNRVQFTPDLMPGDVTGTNIFSFESNSFVLTKGPVFTQLLLADEINRTAPKTQAALLQAMQERQVTIDGTSHDLGAEFMVVATQNPIEHEGTYPLPEAQLDRFLFKLAVDYPSRDEERELVMRHGHRTAMPTPHEFGVDPVIDAAGLAEARALVATIRLSEDMIDYIVDIVRATREHPSLMCGASPRAAAMLATATRAVAALDGREFAIPDDVKRLMLPVLGHRVVLAPGAEIDGTSTEDIVRQIVEGVEAPR